MRAICVRAASARRRMRSATSAGQPPSLYPAISSGISLRLIAFGQAFFKEKNMNDRKTWIVRAGLLVVLICTLLCLIAGNVQGSRGLPPGIRQSADAATPEERATIGRRLRMNSRMVDTSLEVREQVDFLLTPALLVQEAISDGVILTYPEE